MHKIQLKELHTSYITSPTKTIHVHQTVKTQLVHCTIQLSHTMVNSVVKSVGVYLHIFHSTFCINHSSRVTDNKL